MGKLERNYFQMPQDIFSCNTCNFSCTRIKDYNRHIITKKHIQNIERNKMKWYFCSECRYKSQYKDDYENHMLNNHTDVYFDYDINYYFYCNHCDIKCRSYTDYKRHIKTNKHLKCSNFTNYLVQDIQNIISPNSNDNLHTILEAQAKQTRDQLELQAKQHTEQMRELIETITLTPQTVNQAIENTTNNQNTTHNKTYNQFNMNIFLNEYCKDAYTLEDVINQIQYSPEDIDGYSTHGCKDTITHKFHESIKDLPLNKRPIHCTDLKRKSLCVKVENGWERNDEASERVSDSLVRIQVGIHNQFMKWRELHPEHYHKHPQNTPRILDQYHNICTELGKALDRDNIQKMVGIVCDGVAISFSERKKILLENSTEK